MQPGPFSPNHFSQLTPPHLPPAAVLGRSSSKGPETLNGVKSFCLREALEFLRTYRFPLPRPWIGSGCGIVGEAVWDPQHSRDRAYEALNDNTGTQTYPQAHRDPLPGTRTHTEILITAPDPQSPPHRNTLLVTPMGTFCHPDPYHRHTQRDSCPLAPLVTRPLGHTDPYPCHTYTRSSHAHDTFGQKDPRSRRARCGQLKAHTFIPPMHPRLQDFLPSPGPIHT